MEVKNLLKLLVAKDASDLHLVVGLPPMIRINGVLEKAEDRVLASDDIAAMVSEILPPEAKLPTDEDLDLAIDLGSIARFRLNVYRDRNGLCASFRLIPNLIRTLEELGVPNVVAQVAKMRRGLVLITGITGSGKSTTLASLIDMINSTRHDHIITIEDPIEFIHPHKKCVINQR